VEASLGVSRGMNAIIRDDEMLTDNQMPHRWLTIASGPFWAKF